jgi:hypothetical protein
MRAVPHIGTYRRELPVSLERMYENTIDWAHLPYLHRSSFARIECVGSDESGFQAWVWSRRTPEGPPFLLELTLDRDLRRWISRTVEGSRDGERNLDAGRCACRSADRNNRRFLRAGYSSGAVDRDARFPHKPLRTTV